jgi:hypothetical protein
MSCAFPSQSIFLIRDTLHAANGLPPCAPQLGGVADVGSHVSRSRCDSSAPINFPFVQGCVRMIQHASANCPEFHPQVNWRTTSLESSSSARPFRISFGQGTGNGLDRARQSLFWAVLTRLIACGRVPSAHRKEKCWHLAPDGGWLVARRWDGHMEFQAEGRVTSHKLTGLNRKRVYRSV